jgi:hypothetical protein
MRTALFLIAILAASPALAGVCNGVGDFTHCSGDDGSQTNIQRNGDYYQVQTRDSRGNTKTEGYWNYNDDSDR